jgi:hypothetical protein
MGDRELIRGRHKADGLGETVVVDKASVHGEETHQENNVPSAKHGVPDLTSMKGMLEMRHTSKPHRHP